MENPNNQHKWLKCIDEIKPFIFKISTPQVSGTGLQISYSITKKLCGVATAHHVIKHADEWQELIKVTQHNSQKSIVLKSEDRAIFTYPDKDLALIVFNKGELDVKGDIPQLVPPKNYMLQGVEIGWLGFPVISPNDLSFFAGYISAFLSKEMSYLVDGVAINGVSGGPAFFIEGGTGITKICGLISSYISNISTGQILPGLSLVASVEPLQDKLAELKSLDDAKEQVIEEKKEIEKEANTATTY